MDKSPGINLDSLRHIRLEFDKNDSKLERQLQFEEMAIQPAGVQLEGHGEGVKMQSKHRD